MNCILFLVWLTLYYFITIIQQVNSHALLDNELHERVLDPVQCRRQLNYIWRINPLLLGQFVAAGLRVPRGILSGSVVDLGLYDHCLGISEVEYDMHIEGKYCLIGVPANQNVYPDDDNDPEYKKWNFNPNKLKLNQTIISKLERSRRHSFNEIDNRQRFPITSDTVFTLAICIPKVCRTEDALSGLIALDFKYFDYFCRLPNDRPFSTADYVAIFVFYTLGVVTFLSTVYDLHHTVIRKKDPKEANILTSFSAYRNCRQLLLIKSNPNAVYSLDGIRALSTFWVLIGHAFGYYEGVVTNRFDVYDWWFSYKSIWIVTAPLAVDTFFLLSGVLLIYNTAGKLKSTKQVLKNVPFLFLLRLLRLFPVLAAIVLFEVSLVNRLGDGPTWDSVMNEVSICRKNWWTTLLHVQNYVNPRETCVVGTWYLGIDTSLHLISLLSFIIVLGKGRKVALAGLIVIFIASITGSCVYIFTEENIEDDYDIKYYYNILPRAPPFFIGLIFGYIMHLVREKKLRVPVFISVPLTCASLALLGTVIYYFFHLETGRINNKVTIRALFTFIRPLWSLGLGWIIFACASGHGGPINWFLSLNVWRIPARISYAMYLYHMSFMLAVYSNMQQLVIFSIKSAMFDFMAFFAISLIIGFFLTALIDAPFAIIFKALFDKIGQKPRSTEATSGKKINED